MKNFLLFMLTTSFLSLISVPEIKSQDLIDRLKDKVKEKTENKVEEKVDEGIDNVLNKADQQQQEENEDEEQTETVKKVNKTKDNETIVTRKKEDLKYFSKYDFIPGEKTIFYEDFSQDAVGDFPVKWNTNSGGEVVTLNNFPGKWFKMNYGGVYVPEFEGNFTENFTLEYDVIYDDKGETDGPEIDMNIFTAAGEEPLDAYVPGKGGIGIRFTGNRIVSWNWLDQNYGNNDGEKDANVFTNAKGETVKISISVQKQRVRVYAGEKQLIDVPRLFPKGIIADRIRINMTGVDQELPQVYFTNFRLAAGQPDLRSKLLTEGRLVTHGIYFDSGSDKIKPESYGTLKEIAGVLSANADLKVKIIGHTDSDGSDVSNLELSKKRALSVMNSLSKDFGIDGARFETDGKGESAPMDKNETAEGKANNRRVEFIKL